MFKKINQTLITKYPLIWNLKLIWILLTVVLFNSIAFINGYLYFNKKSQLQESNLFNNFFNDGIVFYYIFIGIIIVVIWLYFYIKNNRFKSFYPTSRNYLFKEFLAVFVILFLMFLAPNSFKSGLKTRVSNYMSEEKYLKDIDIINRAQGFTLQSNFGYNSYSRNLTVPVFDSLVSEKETKKLYQTNRKAYLKDNPNYQYEPFLEPYFRNSEFETLLANNFPNRKSYNRIYFPETYSSINEINIGNTFLNENIDYTEPAVAMADFDSIPKVEDENPEIYYNLASLYNYSQLAFNNPKDSTLSHKFYDEQWITLLDKNDRKAIENLLNSYTDLLKEQKIGYQFKHKNWIDYIPNYPYYFIDYSLGSYNQNSDVEENKRKDYINQNSLNRVYESISYAKYTSTWFENFQYYLLTSLIFTVVIISFRFSSFKVWLISLIGAGILAILGGVFGISIEIIIGYSRYSSYIIPLVFYLLFIVFIIYGMKNKKHKVVTGVALNWFTASNVFIGILLLSFYTDIRTNMLEKVYKNNINEMWKNNKELQMLQEFSELYLFINPVLYIISFYFIINLYKKWQAMPEE